MATRIKTYKQDRPKEWLKDHPHERWRCDIFPDDGSEHHGIGETEADAIWQAGFAYMNWLGRA